MIARVRITKRGGEVLRNWALHRCSETALLQDLAVSDLLDGSSGNDVKERERNCIKKHCTADGKFCSSFKWYYKKLRFSGQLILAFFPREYFRARTSSRSTVKEKE